MSDNLPFSWLLQTSIYNITIGGDTVIARVADRVDIMNHGICELRRELKSPNSVVGIDSINSGDLLLFYVNRRCLIIRCIPIFNLNNRLVPDSLFQFLEDTSTITFVGPRNIHLIKRLGHHDCYYASRLTNVVDVGYFAAQILKKPKLLTSKLEELMVEVGLDIINTPTITATGGTPHDWKSVLSEDEVKFAMREVVSCYKIATKLTDDVMGASMRGQSSAIVVRDPDL